MGEIIDKKPSALYKILSWGDWTHKVPVTFLECASNHGYSSIILMYPSLLTQEKPSRTYLARGLGFPSLNFLSFPPGFTTKPLLFPCHLTNQFFLVVIPISSNSSHQSQEFSISHRLKGVQEQSKVPPKWQRAAPSWASSQGRKQTNRYANDAFLYSSLPNLP